jgi:hypothetical protein
VIFEIGGWHQNGKKFMAVQTVALLVVASQKNT